MELTYEFPYHFPSGLAIRGEGGSSAEAAVLVGPAFDPQGNSAVFPGPVSTYASDREAGALYSINGGTPAIGSTGVGVFFLLGGACVSQERDEDSGLLVHDDCVHDVDCPDYNVLAGMLGELEAVLTAYRRKLCGLDEDGLLAQWAATAMLWNNTVKERAGGCGFTVRDSTATSASRYMHMVCEPCATVKLRVEFEPWAGTVNMAEYLTTCCEFKVRASNPKGLSLVLLPAESGSLHGKTVSACAAATYKVDHTFQRGEWVEVEAVHSVAVVPPTSKSAHRVPLIRKAHFMMTALWTACGKTISECSEELELELPLDGDVLTDIKGNTFLDMCPPPKLKTDIPTTGKCPKV